MATQPTGSRLFAKVAKFVRNPSVHWSDLDKLEGAPEVAEPEPTPADNRQALKDMIERKRQEDAIRKAEFDELRQLRRQAALAKPELSDKPTSFGASTVITDMDERALTIRKIDEIEAQMSRQWWKGQKQTQAPQAEVAPPVAPMPGTVSESLLFASTQVKPSPVDPDDIPTQLGYVPTLQTGISSLGPDASFSTEPLRQTSEVAAIESARSLASELNDNLSDPDLEEAAVRFANGDDAGAEAVLLTALRAQPTLTVVAQAQAEALFDLYRSLGQQANFQREALNFARQFGCSEPVWLPLAKASDSLRPPVAQAPAWHCPVQLDLPALAQLPSHLDPAECVALDWSDLKEITEPAAQQLAVLLAAWSAQDGCLALRGELVLLHLLRDATPRGARQTARYWWSLRMDLLRILQLQDDFELAAFEFCMTYETAPSPWVPARCVCRQVSADVPTGGSVDPSTQRSPGVTLAGELQGDVLLGLPTLVDDARQKNQTLIISCKHLIRVDFSAAGGILNWVTHGQAMGCQIEFRDVPFLVAAFFNLIGINQHARVLTRTH
ncbi:MAG: hypothetical protein RLZZ371_266 [Pseudomonadota bacterium]